MRITYALRPHIALNAREGKKKSSLSHSLAGKEKKEIFGWKSGQAKAASVDSLAE